MATEKPQFKVYMPQSTIDEITTFAETSGFKNGKAIEYLWAFFSLRDWNALADRVQKWTLANPYQAGRSPIGLVKLGMIITNWINKT